MLLKVFTVFDSKLEEFLPPFFVKTVGEAIRVVTDLCSDKSHSFYKHRVDFMLFELGSYDTEIGVFNNLQAPKALSLLTEYCNVDSIN